MTKMISRFLTILMAVCGLAVATAPAQAVTTVYEFEGFGATPSTGELVLEDYTPGSSITLANFVSFSFTSSILSYTLTSVSSIAGSFLSVPGENFVNILTPDFAFVTTPFGPWCTGGNPTCSAVTGNSHLWTVETVTPTIPEPAAWALMLLGFGLVGVTLRQRRGAAVVTA